MGDLSPHFSRWEFFDRRTGESREVAPQLIDILECIRHRAGRPVRIVSGYRSKATNRIVGGARRSRHLVAAAADIERGLVTVDEAIACGAVGVGQRDGWAVHVDHRRGGPVTWSYGQ